MYENYKLGSIEQISFMKVFNRREKSIPGFKNPGSSLSKSNRMNRMDRIIVIELGRLVELRLVQPIKFDLGRPEVDKQAHFEASSFEIVDNLRFVLWRQGRDGF